MKSNCKLDAGSVALASLASARAIERCSVCGGEVVLHVVQHLRESKRPAAPHCGLPNEGSVFCLAQLCLILVYQTVEAVYDHNPFPI